MARPIALAGSPTPKAMGGYATVLAVVGEDGSVTASEEIVPASGVDWMTTNYDARKALIVTKGPDIIVVDFDTASIAKTCQQPLSTGLVFGVGQWLVNSPSHGLTYVQYSPAFDRRDSNTDQILGMVMDPNIPCEKSFVMLNAAEMHFAVGDGYAGDSGDRTDVTLAPDGTMNKKWLSGEFTYFDYKIPPALFNDLSLPIFTRMLINNGRVSGFILAGSTPTKRRLLVFRKSDNTWHQAPDPSRARAFGSFVATAEEHENPGQPVVNGTRVAPPCLMPMANRTTGPDIQASLCLSGMVYPGILHLYDAATEKSYTITTNQADSEIILVENNTVYYRSQTACIRCQLSARASAPLHSSQRTI